MSPRLKSLRSRRRWPWAAVALVLVSSVAWALAHWTHFVPDIPTAEVRSGEFVEYLQIRGEVQASKSVVLNAPSGSSEDLEIVKLVRSGTSVKKSDLVAQFDTTKLQTTLDQMRSELKQTEAEIEQTRAQARLTEEQDRTDLMKARYDVERARLEVSKQEIVSQIEGEEAKVKLADAEQRLAEVEQKTKSDKAAATADLEAKQQKRDKAQFEVEQAERNITAMTLRAPADGMITLLSNWRAAGFSDNAPEFKEGDRPWPGAGIAELPDLSAVKISARIDESDRGRLQEGQAASVRVDAVPDKEFTGRVSEISALARVDFSGGWPPKKNFGMTLALAQSDPRLRPGMSATARVAVERVPGSILIPAKAVFEKGTLTVAYVLQGSGLEERSIEVARRSASEVVVARGLRAGERVALKNPAQTAQ